MWANIENDLTLTNLSGKKEFLDNWIKYSEDNKPFEHKKAVVDSVTGLPILTGSLFHYECSYNEIQNESSLYDDLYTDGEKTYTFKDIYSMGLGINSFTMIPVYGVTDFNKEDDGAYCIQTLISNYPELKLLGNIPDRKFMICIYIVTDDFRFHKNGGYRGKDDVEEHVYDSPSEEYLMFSIIEIK